MTTYIFDVSFGCIGISALTEEEARVKGKALGVSDNSILAEALEQSDPLYDEIIKCYACKVY